MPRLARPTSQKKNPLYPHDLNIYIYIYIYIYVELILCGAGTHECGACAIPNKRERFFCQAHLRERAYASPKRTHWFFKCFAGGPGQFGPEPWAMLKIQNSRVTESMRCDTALRDGCEFTLLATGESAHTLAPARAGSIARSNPERAEHELL